MGLLTRQRIRPLCTEPLELRRLLSAPASGLPEVDDGDGRIEIVEYDLAEEGDDGDVALSPSDVPPAVLAAFQQRFPDARILEAEFSREDGQEEYDLTARYKGDQIDVTLSPRGRVLETEEQITADDLPREVLDWVRRNFPGADIGEASVVTEDGGLTYEVLIAPPGRDELEATVRLQEPPTPSDPPAQSVHEAGSDFATPTPAASWLAEPVAAAPSAIPAAESVEPPAPEPEPEDDAPPGDQPPAALPPAPRAPGLRTRSSPFALSLRAILPSLIPLEWIPEVAGLIDEPLGIDLTSIEQRLTALLANLQRHVTSPQSEQSDQDLALRLLLVAAFVGGAHLLIIESRRSKPGPVNFFNSATSTWSWLLGAPPPDR